MNLEELIHKNGGVVTYADGTKYVSFPPPADAAEEVTQSALRKSWQAETAYGAAREAALERAEEYGTQVHPLRRPRGDGWFCASSHTYPGYWYVLQLDLASGDPVQHTGGTYCDCEHGQAGNPWCHHAGAAWRWLDRQQLGEDLTLILEASIQAVTK